MKENLCADLPPVYLRLSVTDRCSFRCQYCRPASRAQPAKACAPASDTELLGPLGLFQQACSIYKLRLTGGEPLLRPNLVRLVRRLRRNMPHAQLCITTNAALLRHAADSLYRAGRTEVVRQRIRDEIAAKCPPNGLWPDRPMAIIGG